MKRKKPDYSKSPYPETCEALWAAGIDPCVVRRDGLSHSWVEEFVVDKHGNKIHDSKFYLKTRLRDWPSHEVRNRVMAIYLREQNALRWGARKEQ